MKYENATFSFDLNNYHFIILTTDIREDLGGDDGGIYKAQCMSGKEINWLKEDLVKNKLPCIIFTHFGLAEDKQIGNYWFEKNPEDGLMNNRQAIKEIIKSDDNVIAIFNGHQHWTKQIIEDGKNYYVVGSLTENIDMLGVPDGIYLEVELEDRKIRIQEKHIEI
jgi:putative phosphoesterase